MAARNRSSASRALTCAVANALYCSGGKLRETRSASEPAPVAAAPDSAMRKARSPQPGSEATSSRWSSRARAVVCSKMDPVWRTASAPGLLAEGAVLYIVTSAAFAAPVSRAKEARARLQRGVSAGGCSAAELRRLPREGVQG